MLWKGFQRPRRVEIEKETLTASYGKFTAQPFERGFATTMGNALRRCLLSSIEGAAITAVHIEGVLHEFSSVPGVVEDVTDIILNLKQVPIRLHSEDAKVLAIDVAGPGKVTAKHMADDPQIEIIDPNIHIATLNEEARFKLQVKIERGRGYVSADRNFDESLGIGWIPVDSAHSPVRRVNFRVGAARLGQTTDYEKLVLEVWTNGTVAPEEAVSLAALLLKEHLGVYIQTEESLREIGGEGGREDLAGLEQILAKTIDELDLSVRSANSLKNANIHNLRDLVRRTEKEMLETKNFGRKSLEEVQEVLDKLGLSLGMNVSSSGASA
ncbi:MAG TPA: DNA-directed RNA polymerase subunit alpha [Thermoanaerobaculia bacterium]|jgi:DNA-directed RNA polymerase subunit alpha|nr:DNA-directed RNA polymerase subunit alpha [Thermoanaerobaculia bacterium]